MHLLDFFFLNKCLSQLAIFDFRPFLQCYQAYMKQNPFPPLAHNQPCLRRCTSISRLYFIIQILNRNIKLKWMQVSTKSDRKVAWPCFLMNLFISLTVNQTVMNPKNFLTFLLYHWGLHLWLDLPFLSNSLTSANALVHKCKYLWRLLLLLPPCRSPYTSPVFVATPAGLWKPVAYFHKPPLVCILRSIWLRQC